MFLKSKISHILGVIVLFLLVNMPFFVTAQSNNGKEYNQAKKYFDDEDFTKALSIFLKLDSTTKKNNFNVKYYIGACYLNTKYEKTKGIPYLEYAINEGEKFLPKDVFFDLGRLYHLNYQFDKSNYFLHRYKKLANEEDGLRLNDASNILQMDSFALTLQKDSDMYEVSALAYPINTLHSEKSAFISADNNTLVFTRTYHKKNNSVVEDSVHKILISEKEKNDWGLPSEINIQYPKISFLSPPELVGISYDAQYLFFKAEQTAGNTDLYIARLNNNRCNQFEPLPDNINSAFNENAISFTPESNVCYFSSNRPGGYGGMDIYRSVLDNNQHWKDPVNMGPMINSVNNEDFPYIHPGDKIIYFSSDNKNTTIGGYDIFVSNFSTKANDWSQPQNIGFPINSPSDDISFVPNAEGNFAYFSSSKGNENGSFNIYIVRLEQNIPLTLVKGFIYESDTKKPVSAQIKVYESDKRTRIKYIYNPNPETGKYLMIFPPGQSYDMIVQAKGYYDHLIKIYVPHQNYFYELYQEIGLKPIFLISENKKLGEEIEVNNIFYDTDRYFQNDSLQIKKITETKNYTPLLNLVKDIISFTDSVGLEYVNNMYAKDQESMNSANHYNQLVTLINEAINTTDSSLIRKINNETIYKEKTSQSYFYNENDSIQFFSRHIIGKDTFLLAEPLNTIKQNYSNHIFVLNDDSIVNKDSVKVKTVERLSYYFASGNFKLSSTDTQKIIKLVDFLCQHPELSLEVLGYADSDGDKQKNIDLSFDRALEVSKIVKTAGLSKDRIVLKGIGEPETPEKNFREKQRNRRVDIIIKEKRYD